MCLSDFLAFDSLPLKQTDMGMDSGGADRPEALTAPAVTHRMASRHPRVTRSRNDQKLISWMRQQIVDLEKLMKAKQVELDHLRTRLAPSTERELYLLSKMELIYLQLESECSNPALSTCPKLHLSLHRLYFFLLACRLIRLQRIYNF